MNYPVERGVKQGGRFCHQLSLMVMDPLLRQLQATGLGLSINNFCAGGADDIRTLATSVESLEAQMAVVNSISRSWRILLDLFFFSFFLLLLTYFSFSFTYFSPLCWH